MSEKLDDFSIEVSERIAARTQDPNLIAANARIRALERDRDAFAKHAKLVEHKVITCGVAARHPDANLSRTGAYGSTWNSPQAEEVRKLRDERDALRRELESASQPGGGEAEMSTADQVMADCEAFEAAMVAAGYNRPDLGKYIGMYRYQRDQDRYTGWKLARAAPSAGNGGAEGDDN